MDNRGEMRPDPSTMLDIPGATATEFGVGTGGAPAHLPYGLSLSSSMAVLRAEHTLEFKAFDHVALRVADVRRAEAFYFELFQMDVVLRARRYNDDWATMPNDFSWTDALRTGIFPDVIVLRNGPITLLLLNAGRGAVMVEPRLEHIGLRVSSDTLIALKSIALIRSFAIAQDDAHAFRFNDPYGITWHLTDEGNDLGQ